MTATRRMLAVLGTALVAALALCACGGSSGSQPSGSQPLPKNAVAEVGSQPITKADYEHWLRITVAQRTHVPAAQAPIPVAPDYKACIANVIASEQQSAHKSETPKPESALTGPQLKVKCAERLKIDHELALSFLIGNAWLNGEAAHLGVKVSNAELQQEFDKLKKEGFPSEADFKTFLADNGYTVSDLLLKTRDELLRNALGKKVLADAEAKPITEQEIVSYYKKHTSDSVHPESRSLFLLLTPTEGQAKAAKSEIQSGQSFESVAKRVSIYHAPGAGGAYTTTVRGHNAAELERAIWGLKPHVLTGPIKTSQGSYVLELDKTTPARTESLHQAEPSIKFALRRKYVEGAVKGFPNEFTAKWKAKTTCQTGYVVEQCKEFKLKLKS